MKKSDYYPHTLFFNCYVMTLALERVVNYLESCESASGGTTVRDAQSEREAQVAAALDQSTNADPLVPLMVRLEALRAVKNGL